MPQEERQSTLGNFQDSTLWKLVVHAPNDYKDLETHVNQMKLRMMAGLEGMTDLKVDDQANFMQKAPSQFYHYLGYLRGKPYQRSDQYRLEVQRHGELLPRCKVQNSSGPRRRCLLL